MSVLTDEQWSFWEQNGYIVVPEVVPEPLLRAVVATIEDFLGKDLANPDDWYQEPMYPGGIINMNHHQAMWDTRQYPRLHEVFSAILGSEKLRVSVDRACMNPPSAPQWDHEGMIHWDMDSTVRPVLGGVQGVLCLSDTAADQGGFQCVPGFHTRLEQWAEMQPADRPPMHPDTAGMELVPVPANAGDLIIWHRALPHGNSRNCTNTPRLCQYITMSPAPQEHQPGARPMARTRRAVVADALGLPEGLVEGWLRGQRDADRVLVRGDRVAIYDPVPKLSRIEIGDRVKYLHNNWGQIIDAQAVEAIREHAERYDMPVQARAEGSVENIRRAMVEIPAPRRQTRLTDEQLARVPDLLAAGPTGDGPVGPLWDEDSAAELMVREFGLEMDVQEAELTPLGRKLAGVEAW